MATLKDIANRSGVTITTVAAVLAGKGRISEATRSRVLKIAGELDYSPNAAARILKNKSVVDIGMVTADQQLMFVSDFLQYCKQNNLRNQLELYDSHSGQLPGLLTPGFAKGILYVGNISPEVENFIRKNPDYPIVTINEHSPYCVCPDFETGVKQAVRYLISRGHRRIAMGYTPDTKYTALIQIQKGVFECWNTLPLDRSPELEPFGYHWDGSENSEKSRAHFKSLLSLKEPPTAFFFSGMMVARALIYDAMRMGVRIPEDISVIAVGYERYAEIAFPYVSIVAYDLPKTTLAAIQLLLRRIGKKKIFKPEIIVKSRLIQKETTSAAKHNQLTGKDRKNG